MSPPRMRPERLIGAARIILAVFALIAVWLDPTEPAKYAHIAYALMVAYVGYAAAVALVVWRLETLPPGGPIAIHAIDLAFFSLFLVFTAGPGSPFNVYFVFALMCGTLRWQLRGTLWTAAAALTAFVAGGLYFTWIAPDPLFDARAFLIRGVYLFLLAVLAAYLGMHEQRLLRDMGLLASWPHASQTDPALAIRPVLAHALALCGAQSIAAVWRVPGRPDLDVAILEAERWEFTEERSAPAVHPDLADRSFLWVASRDPEVLVQQNSQGWHLVPWRGASVDPAWLERLHANRLVSVALTGEIVSGRLFIVNQPDPSTDDVLVAGIVASVLTGRLDAYHLDRELEAAAATEERIRLARDLHDGTLQSFTGIALRLAAIRGRLSPGGSPLHSELDQLQRIIADEQRELRFLIQDLKPSAPRAGMSLDERLDDLVDRFEREWDLEIDMDVDVPSDLSKRLCDDLYLLVREGIANAARHGSATTVSVRIALEEPTRLSMWITDNGRGFSFSGSFSGDQLIALDAGPKTLRERVEAMNGALTLASGPSGVSLHIVVPAMAA